MLLSHIGTDVEDSLYWIAYATQPSNVVPGPVTPSPFAVADAAQPNSSSKTDADAAGATAGTGHYQLRKENEELRRRIAVEAMGLSQRVTRVRRQCEHEQERINRLAEVYQVLSDTMHRFSPRSNAATTARHVFMFTYIRCLALRNLT
jgi:hypothetical protein